MTKMKLEEFRAHLCNDKQVLALSLPALGAYVKLAMTSLPFGGVISACGFLVGGRAMDRKQIERFLGSVEVLDELITAGLVEYDFDNPRVQLGAEELDAGPFFIPFIVAWKKARPVLPVAEYDGAWKRNEELEGGD